MNVYQTWTGEVRTHYKLRKEELDELNRPDKSTPRERSWLKKLESLRAGFHCPRIDERFKVPGGIMFVTVVTQHRRLGTHCFASMVISAYHILRQCREELRRRREEVAARAWRETGAYI